MRKARKGVWHIVEKVKSGTHEFKFIVDGMWRLSSNYENNGNMDEMLKNNVIIVEELKEEENYEQECCRIV